MLTSKDIPALTLIDCPATPDKPKDHYALVGWERVEQWALANYPNFAEVYRDAKLTEIQEADRLKFLVRMLLGQALVLAEQVKLYAHVTGITDIEAHIQKL